MRVNYRPAALAVAVATTLAALYGCSGSDASNVPASTPATSEAPTPTPSETLSEPPAPDTDGDGFIDVVDAYPKNELAWKEETITVICDVKGKGNLKFTIDRIHPDFSEAWNTPLPEGRGLFNGVYCEEESSYRFTGAPRMTPVSGVEQAIWDRDKKPNEYTIPIPYEQCVEHDSHFIRNGWPVSKQQVPEAETALMLCPNHPNADLIRANIADQKNLAQELQTGESFYDGNYRVGPRVKAGTYAVTNRVENCYWERLDRTGTIIDNNFVTGALRVEVTIQPTDFSFHSEGCGLWRKVG